MLAQGLGQGGTTLHIGHDLLDHRLEMRLFQLPAQNVQTLDQRQTGIDHGGELPREDAQVLDPHTLLLQELEFDILGLFLDRGDDDPALPEVFPHVAAVGGLVLAGQGFTLRGFSLPDKLRGAHGIPPLPRLVQPAGSPSICEAPGSPNSGPVPLPQ